VGWIDARDTAAAASALLAGPGVDPGSRRDYLLTGPQALSYRDAAAVITARTGRPVGVVTIGTDERAAAYRAAGIPAEFAAAIAAVEDGIRSGLQDQVSTAVLELTGRPPRTFAAFVQEHAAEWIHGPSDRPAEEGPGGCFVPDVREALVDGRRSRVRGARRLRHP
jgi:uncharacterized protein YbjT (DUF2867 family)